MCVAAGVAAVAIVFILFGPVPVRRKVTIIPRMSAPDPFVDRPAAQMVGLPHVVPPGAAMPPPYAMSTPPVPALIAPPAPMAPSQAAMSSSRADATRSRAGSREAYPSTKPGSRARAATPDVAPLVLRRPGNPNPPPLSRARAARGTEPRPQPSAEEIHALDDIDNDQTAQVTLVQDDTFLEDGR